MALTQKTQHTWLQLPNEQNWHPAVTQNKYHGNSFCHGNRPGERPGLVKQLCGHALASSTHKNLLQQTNTKCRIYWTTSLSSKFCTLCSFDVTRFCEQLQCWQRQHTVPRCREVTCLLKILKFIRLNLWLKDLSSTVVLPQPTHYLKLVHSSKDLAFSKYTVSNS